MPMSDPGSVSSVGDSEAREVLRPPAFVEIPSEEIRKLDDRKVLRDQAAYNTRELRRLGNLRAAITIDAVEAWVAELPAIPPVVADADADAEVVTSQVDLGPFDLDTGEGINRATEAYEAYLDRALASRWYRSRMLRAQRNILDRREGEAKVAAAQQLQSAWEANLKVGEVARTLDVVQHQVVELFRLLEVGQSRLGELDATRKTAWRGILRNVGSMLELARRNSQLYEKFFGASERSKRP
jgi:hypothetical protein